MGNGHWRTDTASTATAAAASQRSHRPPAAALAKACGCPCTASTGPNERGLRAFMQRGRCRRGGHGGGAGAARRAGVLAFLFLCRGGEALPPGVKDALLDDITREIRIRVDVQIVVEALVLFQQVHVVHPQLAIVRQFLHSHTRPATGPTPGVGTQFRIRALHMTAVGAITARSSLLGLLRGSAPPGRTGNGPHRHTPQTGRKQLGLQPGVHAVEVADVAEAKAVDQIVSQRRVLRVDVCGRCAAPSGTVYRVGEFA